MLSESSAEVPFASTARFDFGYDLTGSPQLATLYDRGKTRQWDARSRIVWDLPFDEDNPLGQPPEMLPIFGSKTWHKVKGDKKMVAELFRHTTAWQFSQFLHGEQGALVCAGRLMETVPGLDAKLFAATQGMDEARHAEAYSTFLGDKLGLQYPIGEALGTLLGETLADSRWDVPYLSMQVLIEGLALAAFGLLRDATANTAPLPHSMLAFIMADEARHVAFGRVALRELYAELSTAELREREDFVIEGARLLHRGFQVEAVWERLELDVADCVQAVQGSPSYNAFLSLLFARIVPCLADIGLWTPRVAAAFTAMGVELGRRANVDELMAEDKAKARDADAMTEQITRRRAIRAGAAYGAAS